MPLGFCEALAVSLGGAALGGAAKGGISALTAGKERKHEKDLETMHTTEPGFTTFGDDLANQGTSFANLDLSSANRPVLFNQQNKDRDKFSKFRFT